MARTKLESWQARTDVPLLVAAAVFLVAYALPILLRQMPSWLATGCRTVNYVVWALFALDQVVRLRLARHRKAYLLTHWLDLVALLLPALRPLRAVVALGIITRRSRAFARGQVVAFAAGTVLLVCTVASLAVLDAERGQPSATIHTFAQALWWSVVTVTTVGYGDYYPVTVEGRGIAVALMVTGIALVGVVTASVASWFTEQLTQMAASGQKTQDALAGLRQEVAHLREELRAREEHHQD